MSGTLERASRAAPWSLAAKAIRFVFSMGTSMLVVRLLPAEEYGVLAIVRTIVLFAGALAGFGLGNALNRFLPERETRKSGSRDFFTGCLALQGAGWAFFTVLVFVLRGPIDRMYGSPIGTPLLAGVALLSGNMLFQLVGLALTATFRTKRLAFLQGALSAAVLFITWGALRAGWGVIGVLASASLPYLAVGVWAILRLRPTLAGGSTPPEWKRLFRYALPLAAIQILNLITWQQSETLLLGHFRGPVEAGIFDIAYRIPQLLLAFVPETIWPIVLAAFVEVYTRDRRRIEEMVGHYFRVLFLLVTPITLFGALYGDLLIQVLYGAERALSGSYARIFFIIFHFSFFGTPFSMALYLIEKTWVNLVLAAVFAVINLGLDLILIPRYGLPGAIPPVAIAIGISPLLRWAALRNLHGPVPIPWAFLGRCYAASASLVLLYPLRSLAGNAWGFGLLLLLAAVVLAAAFRFARPIGPEERLLFERSNLPGKRWIEWWLGSTGIPR
ncbi:MAG: oligosaccharide flippase family protein [Candidatus Eisenbacteria bacterium]|nr:oligosaccharide flippase family protein [Candidatus Eisenbacteria bacterium]